MRHGDDVFGQHAARQTPQTARLDEYDGDGGDAEEDQVQVAEIGEYVAQAEVDDNAENGAFDAADAADDHSEDDVDRIIDETERGFRLDSQFLQGEQGAGKAKENRSP